MESTKVGIRVFREGLAEYINNGTPVTITRHGQTVGYFLPAQGHTEAEVAALRKAGAMVDEMLAAHGVDVEDVVQEFKVLRKKNRAKVA
jgi:antitoxin (DNA-binding transcriptional repressor) of toxin-antitoxin stability system